MITALLTAALLSGYPGAQVEFNADFSDVQSSSEACDSVFAVRDYHVLHTLTGPTQRTSVMKLRSLQAGGLFDGLVLVGLFGPDNDLYYDEDVTANGLRYAVHAEGLIDRSVVVLDFKVAASDAQGRTVCTASATLSGFN